MIYAINHKKKAFLSLLKEKKELFLSIPFHSILFQREFYDRVINLNTINARNLEQCLKIKQWPVDILERFYDRGNTFEEIRVLSGLPERYAELYLNLSLPRVDARPRFCCASRQKPPTESPDSAHKTVIFVRNMGGERQITSLKSEI